MPLVDSIHLPTRGSEHNRRVLRVTNEFSLLRPSKREWRRRWDTHLALGRILSGFQEHASNGVDIGDFYAVAYFNSFNPSA
jgi:hypothetical protein